MYPVALPPVRRDSRDPKLGGKSSGRRNGASRLQYDRPGNMKCERNEGKLNVGENEKRLVSTNPYDARKSKARRDRKTSDTPGAFLARAGGGITLIKKSEERERESERGGGREMEKERGEIQFVPSSIIPRN